jgi:hypothetical protein
LGNLTLPQYLQTIQFSLLSNLETQINSLTYHRTDLFRRFRWNSCSGWPEFMFFDPMFFRIKKHLGTYNPHIDKRLSMRVGAGFSLRHVTYGPLSVPRSLKTAPT